VEWRWRRSKMVADFFFFFFFFLREKVTSEFFFFFFSFFEEWLTVKIHGLTGLFRAVAFLGPTWDLQGPGPPTLSSRKKSLIPPNFLNYCRISEFLFEY
jgi:hypothetical protein